MTDIKTDSPTFTGTRILRAVPDGRGGTDLAVLKRITREGVDHDRVLVTLHLDATASFKLARVLRAR